MKKSHMQPKTPKELREALDLTLDALAEKAGISRSSILRAEKNKRFSRIPMIAAAHRKALGVTA